MEAQQQIEKFQEFIENNYEKEIHSVLSKGKKSLVVDFRLLAENDPDLAGDLLDDPENTIKSAELSLEHFDIKNPFRVRFRNLPKTQEMMIKDIRSEHLDKFLSFMGIVRQASDIRPQVVSARFECPSCGNILSILQIDPKFKEPTRCSCGRRGKFRLLNKDLVDAQRLIVEEAPEDLQGGEQPKRLAVFLKEDLVEPIMEKKTTPGSKIRINGVIKEVPVMLKTGAQSIRYDLIAESNYVEPLEQTFEDIEIDSKEIKEIEKLAKDPKIYERLIKSIAPSIYGHERIKEAILFQLMGGVKKERDDGTKSRGDIHVLLVGDPGSGKSQILKFVSQAAPKARYVSGKGATTAGLTASVVRDEFLKGWALEAGALVLSNFGIACLDELDKLSTEDSSALHEGMEQQTISIAKANIQATLRSETTVLAAANPKLGRFDPYQPVASQIEMPPTLINRFDLIFTVRDLPNKELDEKIAKYVLKLQQEPKSLETEVPTELLKKYIAYVKQKIFPILTKGAVDEIRNFYVGLRSSGQTGEGIKPIPISARQLEALVRLAEASARIRLSDKVTKEDAKRAIDLLKHCLMQVGYDYETKSFDIDIISTGVPASERSRIHVIREIINDLEEKIGKTIPITEILDVAKSKNINESQVEEILERLKREGEVFEPQRGIISKL
ncbi:MAG: minichromosome maintenance protein MCM [Candidatus Nanoarchaeia archaeon]|jgi:replicative DNA helicase Mcm|nr:minichromosome maintenance protein MCM [Candidatus Nanoarchaeia archaeon]|tara:strand:- start:14820 stop:16829 length:2010 start_codon:yes stop_codon:yes gene_type:complete